LSDPVLDGGRLEAWLAANVAGYAGPLTVQRFAGGQSNPTYALSTPGRDYVLRSKPVGALLPTAHAVEREHRAIAALHPTGFPVPEPMGLCEDPSVIGAPFYVMEKVEGRILRDPALPDCTADERRSILFDMVDTLARLHSLGPEAIGLADYGRGEGYLQRQIDRWTRQYEASAGAGDAPVAPLAEALQRTAPTDARTALIHGDFKLDNVVLQADAPKLAAVLDWELSTLGDPLVDLSYLLVNWVVGPLGPPAGRPETGVPSVEAMAARYAERAGLSEAPDLSWRHAFNQFRSACILQGIVGRVKAGTAAAGPEATAFAERVGPLMAQAWTLLKGRSQERPGAGA
jgi:aminoglycoside phosphotransferase (APT) family kinase protein